MTARETVEDLFFAHLGDPSEAALAEAHAEHADAVEATLAYLRDRHVAGVAPTGAWEQTVELPGVVARILRAGGPDAAWALCALALDAGRPEQARPLSDILMGVVAADDLARALIDALERGTERQRLNAREVAYHTFDAAGDDYAPSAAVREQLDVAFRASAGRKDADGGGDDDDGE